MENMKHERIKLCIAMINAISVLSVITVIVTMARLLIKYGPIHAGRRHHVN